MSCNADCLKMVLNKLTSSNRVLIPLVASSSKDPGGFDEILGGYVLI